MSQLSLFEIDSYVRDLQCLGLSSVGSDVWMSQHDKLEKLNIQAHHEAMKGKHDEYVVEQIGQQNKMEVLVHELLVIEAWKASVFPLLLSHFSQVTAVKAYIVLYHEATICNLLEVLLYHASSVESASEESMVELGDYCARKLNLLNTGAFKSIQKETKEDAKASLNKTAAETLQQQNLDIGFSVAVCATSILRFLSDHVNVLPLGVTSRMLHTHDVLLSLVPLVENPPWTRTRANGRITEKFSDQRWMEVKGEDRLMMTKLEGQVWLTIYNLIMDKACRKQYQYNTYRKEVLIRLKRFFTDILMDQLPMLRELKRFIEELSIMEPPPPTANSMAIIEQVPEMREGILKGVNFEKLAEQQKKTVFDNDPAARQKDIARLAATYNMDSFEDLIQASCGGCGKSGDSLTLKKCSRCKMESYCGRPCQVAAWKRHQKMCDTIAKSAPPQKQETKNGSGTATTGSGTKEETKKPATASSAASPTPAPVKPVAATEQKKAAATPAATPAATATSSPAPAPAVASKAAPAPASAPAATPATTVPLPANAKAFASGKIVLLDEDDGPEAAATTASGPDAMD